MKTTNLVLLFGVLCFNCLLACAEPFTIIALPDTQMYTWKFPSTFVVQTQWIVDHQNAENIVFVTHVGDIVENYANAPNRNHVEWELADRSIDNLDAAPDLPYGVSIGNHDYDSPGLSSTIRFVEFFGASRYTDERWYGGSSADQLNHYQFFDADRYAFLHINLEYQPSSRSIAWAQSILDANPTTPTIITTHEYLGISGRVGVGEILFQRLVANNPQVFMVLSGHHAGEHHQQSINFAGLPVFEILANYQSRLNGGNGFLRLISFDPDANQIEVKTYSPPLQEYETGVKSQFTFHVDFRHRFHDALIPEPSSLFLMALGVFILTAWFMPRS